MGAWQLSQKGISIVSWGETQGGSGKIAEFLYCDLIIKVAANEQVGNDSKNIKEKCKEYIEYSYTIVYFYRYL